MKKYVFFCFSRSNTMVCFKIYGNIIIIIFVVLRNNIYKEVLYYSTWLAKKQREKGNHKLLLH
jgi:hypothetical protein